MGRILVVGASGYIGARLSYLLAKENYAITTLCYPNVPDNKEWISLMHDVVIGDITKEKTIDKITDNYYDVVIYLVSLDHNDSNKKPAFVNSINVLPVWNLLEAFKTKNTLRKFIYFSTIHVYGKITNEAIKENYKTNPIAPYGLTHLLAENICNMYNISGKMNCINIRLSNSYGSPFFKENNCWWLVVNDLCRTAFNEHKIVLKSDGSPLRDFIHYRDIFKAIKTLIKSDTKNLNNVFNLSSGKTLSIFELATKVKNVYEEKYKEEISIIFPKGAESRRIKERYTISNKALKNIGFKDNTSIEEGIDELFDYLEKNEER
jgi:UDP-glucose 4-epimerase